MGGTTPNGLPYPTGTDRVADGDNAIEALARAIDPWYGATVKYDAEAPINNVNGFVLVKRRGSSVHLNYDVTAAVNLGAGHIVATVPDGYRPGTDIFVPAYNVTNPDTAPLNLLQVRPNGTFVVALTTVGTGMRLVGNASWALA